MNREIKFRAWNKRTNQFGRVCDLIDLMEFAHKKPDAIEELIYLDFSQYTGLKDKQGREIYEGDIVTTGIFQDINGKQEECRFVVEWKGKYGMWGLANRNAITTFILSEVSMWEVIGNIYENPELLKERIEYD